MPSEPAESNFKNKVHAKAYPCHERNGIIWAYMGPREVPPPLPDMEANMLNTDPEKIRIMQRPCNWMQGLEGELDTIHAAFLHWGFDEPGEPGSLSYYHFKNRDEAALRRQGHGLRHRLRLLPPGGGRHLLLAHRHGVLPVLRHAGAGRHGPRGQDERLRADGRRAHAAVGDLRQRHGARTRACVSCGFPLNRGTRAA